MTVKSETRERIQALLDAGETHARIAATTGVSERTIGRLAASARAGKTTAPEVEQLTEAELDQMNLKWAAEVDAENRRTMVKMGFAENEEDLAYLESQSGKQVIPDERPQRRTTKREAKPEFVHELMGHGAYSFSGPLVGNAATGATVPNSGRRWSTRCLCGWRSEDCYQEDQALSSGMWHVALENGDVR